MAIVKNDKQSALKKVAPFIGGAAMLLGMIGQQQSLSAQASSNKPTEKSSNVKTPKVKKTASVNKRKSQKVKVEKLSVKTPATKEVKSDEQKTEDYTVVSGDSLWKIANDHNMSLQELLDANKDTNLKTDSTIFAGDKVHIKAGSDVQTQTQESTYTVVAGDSLAKIAQDHNMSLDQLLQFNPKLSATSTIMPGDVLNLVETEESKTELQAKQAEENAAKAQQAQAVQVQQRSAQQQVVQQTPVQTQQVVASQSQGSSAIPSGAKLSSASGVFNGPSGKETYYNLDMSQVVANAKAQGASGDYWVRADGVKMLGNYVMVAANLSTHPRLSIVPTSLGQGIVVDTGGFAYSNANQLDIATNW